MKEYKPSAWKENIEVVFVAVVIAMGIRAYFIQQFKIPTGSMQPTLNGIIAYPTKEMNPTPDSGRNAPEGYERPGLPGRIWDQIWYGRSHVEWVIPEDDYLVLDREHVYGKTHFIFFPRTYLTTQNGHTFSASGTDSRVKDLLNTSLLSGAGGNRLIEVKAGQVIGFMGDTGSPGAVHLHLEVRPSGWSGSAVDPVPLIRALCG